jgi:RNA polymerase subunit RPABC4/transcription elongation factor Spt4
MSIWACPKCKTLTNVLICPKCGGTTEMAEIKEINEFAKHLEEEIKKEQKERWRP